MSLRDYQSPIGHALAATVRLHPPNLKEMRLQSCEGEGAPSWESSRAK